MRVLFESDAGITGNPTLHVGGEQEAVIVAAPGEAIDKAQDWVQPVAVPIAAGREELQVRGILDRTTSPLVLAREVLPITSVIVAMMVCEAPPLAIETLVWPDPAARTSRAMFCTGQVAKKSSAGEFAPCEFVSC